MSYAHQVPQGEIIKFIMQSNSVTGTLAGFEGRHADLDFMLARKDGTGAFFSPAQRDYVRPPITIDHDRKIIKEKQSTGLNAPGLLG